MSLPIRAGQGDFQAAARGKAIFHGRRSHLDTGRFCCSPVNSYDHFVQLTAKNYGANRPLPRKAGPLQCASIHAARMVNAASSSAQPQPAVWALDRDFNEGFRQWLVDVRVLPVVRADCAEDAIAVSEALITGGITAIEMTLTVPDATRAIAALADRLSVTVGAGSVRSRDDAERAIDAGATFIVSPTCEAEVIQTCQRRQVPCVLGALTPTEVAWAHSAGAAVVKVFPVGSMGGPSYIKGLKAPLPDIPLMATGGVTLAEVEAYVNAGAIAVGIGNELANVAAVRRGDADDVVRAAQALRARLFGAKGAR